MKKKNLLHSGALALLLAACSTTPQSGKQEGQIDIVPAFENQTELKVSHLGKNIRYVPLETNESSLIGQSWSIRLLEDKILVSSKDGNLLFDRQTGKFLRKVSGMGQGPQEYNSYIPFIHPETGDIYFNRTPKKMIRFNQDGKFLGELALPFEWNSGTYLTFDGKHALAPTSRYIYRFDADAQINDSITLPLPGRDLDVNGIESVFSLVGKAAQMMGVGMFGVNGITAVRYKSRERMEIMPSYYPSIYRLEGETCFHEAYNDTIFSIKGNQLSPRWVFNMGEYHFPRELYGNVKESLDRIVVTYATENERLLFFQCAKGWFAEGKLNVYNAIYNKKENTLLMNDKNEGFTDDLANFMPFHPEDFTPKGEYIGALNVWDIQKWTEEHPDIKLEGALVPLKDLADDANPIAVIVEP